MVCRLKTTVGGLILAPVVAGHVLAQISIDPNAGVRPPVERPSLCAGPRPTCGCPGARATCVNGRWLCVNPLERCNGRDDNCDGRVDEGGGEALCNDGLACTVDACLRGSCAHVASHRKCQDSISCTANRCEPGNPGRDSNGCVVSLDHSVCDDKCNCNGLEQCMPASPGADAKGCVRGSPPCERDANACTVSICCETGQASCVNPICSSLPSSVLQRVISANGSAVLCSGETALPAGACDDHNPCTTDSCDATLGCQHSPVPDHGPVIASREQGCVQTVCEGGHPVDRQVDDHNWSSLGVTKPRCGDDADKDTCRRKACVVLPGTSANVCWPSYLFPGPPHLHDPCNDGLQCNGTEICGSVGRPYTNVDGSASLPGCRRVHENTCDDNNVCTTDSCTEPSNPNRGVRQCTHTVRPECKLK